MTNRTRSNHLPGKLDATTLEELPDGSHADGGNLYLLVRGASRAWVFRYVSPTVGRRRNMGLGPSPAVSLTRARELAREYRRMLKDRASPVDPLQVQASAKSERMCNWCGEIKSLLEFHHRAADPMGYAKICKECKRVKDKSQAAKAVTRPPTHPLIYKTWG